MPTAEDIADAAADGCTMLPRRELNVVFPSDIPEDVFWARVRAEIIENPRRVAERVGIPEIGWLTDLKQPEPSFKLDDVLEAYIRGKKTLSAHWARKTKAFWREFCEQVGKPTLREIVPEDIERYHDFVWAQSKTHARSPTWVNHRLEGVRTVLRHALKKQKDVENVRRVLDLTAVFERERKAGLDPRPIEPAHFRELLRVSDEKWRAVLLCMLNCCMYPGEVAAIKKNEVDLQKRVLVTRRTKTGVVRAAVLWERTVREIEAYLKAEPSDSESLFVSQNGGAYSANHISRNFRRRRGEAGLPENVRADMIRDGSYSAAIRGCTNPAHAEILAGHRCGEKDAYVRRDPQMVAQVCEAVERAYFPEDLSE
jgi:integrase